MNASTPKKREWPVICVFVSSTFTDFKHERDALHQNVFRKMELHCRTRGFQFQAIDLRGRADGGRAGPPHHANLLRRTASLPAISPQPNFLILLRNRYGWRPLPEAISAEEFGRLLTTANDNHTDYRSRSATAFLRQWYVQDEKLPPGRVRQGLATIFRCGPWPSSTATRDKARLASTSARHRELVLSRCAVSVSLTDASECRLRRRSPSPRRSSEMH